MGRSAAVLLLTLVLGACVAASADDYKHDDYKHKPHKYENEPKAKSMCNMRNKYECPKKMENCFKYEPYEHYVKVTLKKECRKKNSHVAFSYKGYKKNEGKSVDHKYYDDNEYSFKAACKSKFKWFLEDKHYVNKYAPKSPAYGDKCDKYFKPEKVCNQCGPYGPVYVPKCKPQKPKSPAYKPKEQEHKYPEHKPTYKKPKYEEHKPTYKRRKHEEPKPKYEEHKYPEHKPTYKKPKHEEHKPEYKKPKHEEKKPKYEEHKHEEHKYPEQKPKDEQPKHKEQEHKYKEEKPKHEEDDHKKGHGGGHHD